MLHLVPGQTGGSELYARRLIPALLEADSSLELVLLASSRTIPSLEAEPWSGSVELVGLPFDARSRVRRVLAEQTLLSREVASRNVELLHNLFTTAPAILRVPQVTTIHDVIYKRFPETHGGVLSKGLAGLVWVSARRSQRVIAPSEAAKRDIVRFTGWLDDAVLDGLYRAATCLVFPSLAEGFGLPVLDALARGTLVATSNATSLPEVAGDAALYFEPEDMEAIAASIARLLADESLRARLSEAGPLQAAKFSWARTAEASLESYRRGAAGLVRTGFMP